MNKSIKTVALLAVLSVAAVGCQEDSIYRCGYGAFRL